MKTFEKVYSIVSKIPRGKVLTYGRISQILSINPRVVGFALHANKNPKEVPCHRVVNRNGELAKGYIFGGEGQQQNKLMEEGVSFTGDRVSLEASLFEPKQSQLGGIGIVTFFPLFT